MEHRYEIQNYMMMLRLVRLDLTSRDLLAGAKLMDISYHAVLLI